MVQVEIIGPDCQRIHQMVNDLLDVAAVSSIPIDVTRITDPVDVLRRGIHSVPLVVFNGEPAGKGGRLLSRTDLLSLLTDADQG